MGFLSFFKIIDVSRDEIKQATSTLFTDKTKVWDPAGQLDYDFIRHCAGKTQAEFLKLEQNPKKIKRKYNRTLIFSILVTLFSVYSVLVLNWPANLFVIVILSWIYFGTVSSAYTKLAKDIIKLRIALEHNWIYNPIEDNKRWAQLSQGFPEIFDKGNKNRYVEDQYWGHINHANAIQHFTAGIFSYTVESGHGKNRSSRTYTKNYFIFPLHKNTTKRFHLYPENTFSRFFQKFSRKEINTESIAFNKAYAFSYKGKKGDMAQDITKVLSPIVQEELVKLRRSRGKTDVLFAENSVVFLFDGFILKKMKTNLKKSIQLHRDDKILLENRIHELVEISLNLEKCI